MYTTKSKFSHKREGTVARCGNKKCTTCLQLIVRNTFIFKTTNQEFKVKQLELQHHVCSIRVDMGGM